MNGVRRGIWLPRYRATRAPEGPGPLRLGSRFSDWIRSDL